MSLNQITSITFGELHKDCNLGLLLIVSLGNISSKSTVICYWWIWFYTINYMYRTAKQNIIKCPTHGMVLTKFWQMCACPFRYLSLLQFNRLEEQVSPVSAACTLISCHLDGKLSQSKAADLPRSNLDRVIGFQQRNWGKKINLHQLPLSKRFNYLLSKERHLSLWYLINQIFKLLQLDDD